MKFWDPATLTPTRIEWFNHHVRVDVAVAKAWGVRVEGRKKNPGAPRSKAAPKEGTRRFRPLKI